MLFKVLAMFFSEDVYYALQCGFNVCVGIWISECDHSNQGYWPVLYSVFIFLIFYAKHVHRMRLPALGEILKYHLSDKSYRPVLFVVSHPMIRRNFWMRPGAPDRRPSGQVWSAELCRSRRALSAESNHLTSVVKLIRYTFWQKWTDSKEVRSRSRRRRL